MNNAVNNNTDISYIAKFWGESFYSIPRSFKKKMKHLLKTTIIICEELFEYFSSETGRFKARKVLSINDIKELTGFSKSAILKSIDEIESNEIFLVYRDGIGKDKTYGFYVRTIKNIELFEKIKEGKINLKLNIKKDFFEIINNIIDHKKNQTDHKKNQNEEEKNETDFKKNQNEVPEIPENTKVLASENSSQETYIKEYYIKEALHNIEENKILIEQKGNDAMNAFLKKGNDLREEKTNNDNDSTNQKSDTLENKINEIPQIIKSDEKTKESVGNFDKELDELDRIKQILIYDYGFTDAGKIIKQYSVKCFNECIDMTIQAEYDNKIKTSAGAYLRTKLKNWSEIIIDHEKVLSNGKNLPPAKKVIEKTYLLGEISFVEFMKSKKYLTHTFNQDINNAVKTMIYNLHYEKADMIEFKELFTKEMIESFINKVEIENRFFSTNLNGQWYKDLKFNDEKTLFWNAFDNPDLLPEPKKLNEKILNDNLFSEIKKKESEKNISDTKDDFIP